MLQGVVFDLDGTLIDSEPVWDLAFKQIVEAEGKPYDPAVHRELLGTGIRNSAATLKERFGLNASVEELVILINSTFGRLMVEYAPSEKSGATNLLRALKAAGVPVAIATGSSRPIIEALLARMGWQDLIATAVTAEDIENSKPAPDVYLEAARRLGCDGGVCVAFEDAPSGIKSAKAAGLKVVGLADPRFAAKLDDADKMITSLTAITLADLDSIIVEPQAN